MKRPYLLFKRGKFWYYRFAGEKTFHTTGQKTRSEAEAFMVELLRSAEGSGRRRHLSFRRYAEPFFDWDRCPHIRRMREEGKSITRRHAKIQRGRMKKHVLTDSFASKRLSEITRADVLDLRSRLLTKNAPATVNKALGVVKVIFREALYREEINRDPTAGVGRVKYQKEERGIFTTEELRALFPDHGHGPWWDILDYTCFYLSFRHTINTMVRNAGHDPAKVQAVLGWMDEAVQDNYTHWDLDHLRAWVDVVDEIWKV